MPIRSPNPAGAKPPSVVNLSLYRDGRRLVACSTLQQLFDARRKHPGAVAWVGLYRPSHDDVALLAREFDLHELAVEDAITAHQRPKLERYGDTLFVVLPPPATSTTSRRSSSANCTSSSARTS